MQRWIKNGGWIAILTVCIFLAYCTFYLVHTHKAKPKPPIQIFDAFTLTAYADDQPASTEDSPMDGPDTPPSEPSGDSPEDIPHDEPIQPQEESQETPEEDPTDPAAVVSGEENPAENEDDETTIEEPENRADSTEYDGGGISQEDETLPGETFPEDEITLLIQTRDIMNMILHLFILCISGFFVWLIIYPIWKMAKY